MQIFPVLQTTRRFEINNFRGLKIITQFLFKKDFKRIPAWG